MYRYQKIVHNFNNSKHTHKWGIDHKLNIAGIGVENKYNKRDKLRLFNLNKLNSNRF